MTKDKLKNLFKKHLENGLGIKDANIGIIIDQESKRVMTKVNLTEEQMELLISNDKENDYPIEEWFIITENFIRQIFNIPDDLNVGVYEKVIGNNEIEIIID